VVSNDKGLKMIFEEITLQTENTLKKMMEDACKAKEEHIANLFCNMAEGAKFLWLDLCQIMLRETKNRSKHIELSSKIHEQHLKFNDIVDNKKVPLLEKYYND